MALEMHEAVTFRSWFPGHGDLREMTKGPVKVLTGILAFSCQIGSIKTNMQSNIERGN
jgi:hypothetical protein